MVKLTMELISKSSGTAAGGDGRSAYNLTSPKASSNGSSTNEQAYLRKLTHLYLQDKNIEEITGLSTCKNLLVLYLYDNKLTGIPYLGFAKSLTHLYLQNNAIDRMENLRELKSLTKLYVGGNNIIVIEGIEFCDRLKELHVEHQQLPPGEKIVFDPRSIRGIASTLEVLNVSGDRMESLEDLMPLSNLRHLMANDNFFEGANEVSQILGTFGHLEKVELLGNPCVSKSRYRERIVQSCPLLQTLDGKEITATIRSFMTSLAIRRKENTLKQSNNNNVRGESPHMADDLDREKTDCGDGEGGSIVPSYVMPRLPHRRFEEVLARSQTIPPPSEGERARRQAENSAKASGRTKLSVVNYVGPGASAFMADPNDDRLRASIALKAAYEAATEGQELRNPHKSFTGGAGGTFMGAVRRPEIGGISSGHR